MPIERLPLRLQAPAVKLRSFLLTDAAVMIILGLECIGRGAAYLDNAPPAHPSERWFSITTWAVVWVALGAACLSASVKSRSLAAAVCTSACVGINMVWAGSLATAMLTSHGPNTGWGGSAVYAAVGLLALHSIWKGNRIEIRVRQVTND